LELFVSSKPKSRVIFIAPLLEPNQQQALLYRHLGLAPERQQEGKTRQSKTHAHRDGGAKTRKWRDSAAKPADSERFNQTKSQILNKYSCQESTLSSVEIYPFFTNAENKKNPAQEVHLATSKTGK
jgi:hypothetical protein